LIGTTSDLFVRFYLDVQNNGDAPVTKNQIRVKYWFTYEKEHVIDLANNPGTGINVALTPVTGREGADMVADVTFTDSTSIVPGAKLGEMEIKIVDDWWDINQNDLNDYSYRSTNPTTMEPNPKVTVYYGGTLVYGTEPALYPCFNGI
jgi:hypothetical protein